MYKADLARLEKLLLELCNAQDSVTHYKEKGADFVEQTRHAIEKRDEIRKRIVDFVTGCVDELIL
jgi:hypothetical protein